MKKVAIVQSNYIPWKGYFDLIAAVDEFIFFDGAQFTRRDWRNRNQIKSAQGPIWLTVPVKSKGRFEQAIKDTEIDGNDWAKSHWKTLQLCYARATHFSETASIFAPFFANAHQTHLSRLNSELIEMICRFLGIDTPVNFYPEEEAVTDPTERLAHLCRQAGAKEYVSGPAARAYLNEETMARFGIKVTWFDYGGYPEYPQLWGSFVHEVSVLDLLFNCGQDAPRYMKYVQT